MRGGRSSQLCRRRRSKSLWRAAPALVSLLCSACGGSSQETREPIQQETAADEVLRIGGEWISRVPDKGILSPPSEVSVFSVVTESTIQLSEESASERLVIEENVELRNGDGAQCRTEFSHPLQLRWGRRQGEAAVELIRPALNAQRNCRGLHPEPVLRAEPKRALFILRSDQLVAVEPPLEDRIYRPK